jgi:leader peptidase (prepilin peptidase)/N-methyltransferase
MVEQARALGELLSVADRRRLLIAVGMTWAALTWWCLVANGPADVMPLLVVMTAACCALWIIDVRWHRLPNALVYPLYPAVLAGLALSAAIGPRGSWTSAAAGALLWGGVLVGLHVLSRGEGMGLGDVKLAPVLGAVLGWFAVSAAATGLLLAFLLGGGWALGCMLTGRSRRAAIAFGPFLIAGWALELVMGAGLASAG